MKITAERDPLAAAVAQAARALPKTGITPVLMGMRLDADSEGLTASAYDYEVSSQERVHADVDGEGTVVVPGKLLSEIVRSLPDRPVRLETDDSGRVAVRAGASLFTLHQLPAEEYPALPEFPPLAGTIGSATLCDAIAQTVIAAGKDDTLPHSPA